ncbi:MAG: hypothetical protein ABEL04_08975 [Salinibacter sp.]|uniref:hypothetical protein n=1 Tax=Salinibacter sp. TaxID=2065818 RepID=UPI0035D42269
MPNTLAHAGAQGLATRSLRDVDLRWVYLGCVIPDLPWILQRALLFAVPGIDPYALQAYTIVQASLFGCLLLCAAAALLSGSVWGTFAILGGNVVLHLVLDAVQTKWGAGVHFLAPFSWTSTNWSLFWPESIATYALTALGLAYVAWHGRPTLHQRLDLVRPNAYRLAGIGVLLVGYFTVPFLLLQGPVQADASSLKTLSRSSNRIGHRVALDRAQYVDTQEGPCLKHYQGRVQMQVEGLEIQPPATVSIRGVLVAENKIRVADHHVHIGKLRNYPSYVGLAFIAVVWMGAVRREYATRPGPA